MFSQCSPDIGSLNDLSMFPICSLNVIVWYLQKKTSELQSSNVSNVCCKTCSNLAGFASMDHVIEIMKTRNKIDSDDCSALKQS